MAIRCWPRNTFPHTIETIPHCTYHTVVHTQTHTQSMSLPPPRHAARRCDYVLFIAFYIHRRRPSRFYTNSRTYTKEPIARSFTKSKLIHFITSITGRAPGVCCLFGSDGSRADTKPACAVVPRYNVVEIYVVLHNTHTPSWSAVWCGWMEVYM